MAMEDKSDSVKLYQSKETRRRQKKDLGWLVMELSKMETVIHHLQRLVGDMLQRIDDD